MKYLKLLSVIFIFSFNGINPIFNPKINAFIFKPATKEGTDKRGPMDPQCRVELYSGHSATENAVNRFSNYLIPAKEEAIELVLNGNVPHAKPLSYALQAIFKAYCLCPNKDDYGKVNFDDFKKHVFETGQSAGYNYGKQLLVEAIRKQIDPYLKSFVKKTELLNHIENRKVATVLGYIAHRSVNCALDLGCDAAYSTIKSTIFRS